MLELGAGIGDHTSFFLDRDCDVTITEAREESTSVLRERFPNQQVVTLDLDSPDPSFEGSWDVVYAYGLLYHLSLPAEAISRMASWCGSLLLLETCVTPGNEVAVNPVSEPAEDPSQAASGVGCRPTRPWVMQELGAHFEHVYTTVTQPWHEEFPLDWSAATDSEGLTRAVFVASREPLDNAQLTPDLPELQDRH